MAAKWEAGVVKINGKPVGNSAFVAQDWCVIANVYAGPMFGPDDAMREIALKNAEHIAKLHNDSLKQEKQE